MRDCPSTNEGALNASEINSSNLLESAADRRQFIKTCTFAAAYSSLLGKAWSHIVAAELQPLSTGNTGTLRIKVADFPALLEESGSVRFAINSLRGTPPNGPTPNGQFYPVIVNRAANNLFHALNSRCGHQGCVVEAMDASTQSMLCLCHGSIYGIDGRRISGPTPSSLTKYTASYDGAGLLTVQIPGLAYTVTASPALTAAGTAPRLRLTFSALRNVPYEVLFRDSLSANGVTMAFATTENGALNQTIFSPTANTTASLFVERTKALGFYTVAVRLNTI